MTQPTDSTPENGKQTPPAPVVSQSSEGQPHSAAQTFDQDALRKQIVSDLDEIIDKKFQSTKDKRFGKLESMIGDFEVMSQYLKAANGDPALAARNYKIDQLVNNDNNSSPANGGTVQQGGEQRMAEARVTALIDELGLAQDDEVFTTWAKGSYRSEEAAELALRRAHSKAVKQGRPAMPGNAAFTGGGRAVSTDREDRKHELYAEKGRLQMNAHLHTKRLAEIDAELKQLG